MQTFITEWQLWLIIHSTGSKLSVVRSDGKRLWIRATVQLYVNQHMTVVAEE